ncbi:MAG TPA: hypothetical protein VGB51_08560 [Actinomycetota bacterium]
MDTKRIGTAAIVTATLALVASAAVAAPSISITSPASGAVISRSASPQLQLSGTVGFDAPAPVDREIYLRYDGPAGGCGHAYLSDEDGADPGNSCSNLLQSLAVTPGEDDYTESWPAEEVALPITLDASRNLTGSIYLRSNLDEPTWAVVDVEVLLGSQSVRQRFDDGLPQASSFRTFNLNIDIPTSLDKVDINSITVNVHFQTIIGLIWVELDAPASYVNVPAYSASFDRRVQVAVDTGQFSGTGVTLSPDLTTWTATIPTPLTGIHSIKARSVQGSAISTVDQRSITVTA